MFRSLLPRTSLRTAARSSLHSRSVPLSAWHVRLNSSQAKGPVSPDNAMGQEATPVDEVTLKKQRLQEQDDLQRDWDAVELSYEDVKPRTEQPTPDRYLIDCREPDEVLQGSIPSAVNLPLSVLANSLHLNPEAFKARFGWEKPKVDQEIVFYCRSGKRAATACDIAKRNGYKTLYNYKGSWIDWTSKEGNKTS